MARPTKNTAKFLNAAVKEVKPTRINVDRNVITPNIKIIQLKNPLKKEDVESHSESIFIASERKSIGINKR